MAVNIVLGQLDNVTGFDSDGPNRLVRALDSVIGLPHYHWPSLLVGVITLGLILILERTRLGALALVVAVVVGSLVALPFSAVETLSDIVSTVPTLPGLSMPDLQTAVALLIPAVSLALVGLVQGAAISGSIPNPDGRYPEASADFRGQGIANLATGVLQGMPVGGSMSATALVRAAGAKSALANLVAGLVMIATIVTLGRFIGYIAMPALAALLILVGLRTFKPEQVLLVWRTGTTPIAVFLVTFALTILIPLQYAVIAGVGLSIVLHVARQSNRVRVVRWIFEEPGSRPTEVAAPSTITPGETLVLCPYGSLFFASAQSFREQLPTPTRDVTGAYVVIRLRGTEELGITFLTMLRGYAQELADRGATLMLAGVDADLLSQLRTTGVITVLGEENLFPARPRLGDSLEAALAEIEARSL